MKICALALGKIGKFNSFSVTGALFYIHMCLLSQHRVYKDGRVRAW